MPTSYAVPERNFSVKHHDTVGPFVEILLKVYGQCQRKTVGSHIDLDEVHDHVFGNKNLRIQRCDWCSETFETRRDFRKGCFVNDPSMSRMKEILNVDFDQYQEERRRVLDTQHLLSSLFYAIFATIWICKPKFY